MTDRELRKLKRGQLLELMVEQSRRIEQLEKQVSDLQSQLEDRKIKMSECGSIAEAALKLNGVFEAAQKAADQYLESLGIAGTEKQP